MFKPMRGLVKSGSEGNWKERTRLQKQGEAEVYWRYRGVEWLNLVIEPCWGGLWEKGGSTNGC